MPVWAAVLIALVSGGAGVWVTTWNDRHERFRDRMIDAADDLVSAGSVALIAVRDAIYRVTNDLPTDDTVTIAWKKRDDFLTLSARVELLFGPTSETAQAATELTSKLAQAIDRAQPPQLNAPAAESLHLEARASLTALQQSAFEDIRVAAPPSARVRESVRQALQR